MSTARILNPLSQEDSRAQRFLDDVEPVRRQAHYEDVTESVDLSGLRSRFNQASQQAKKTPVTAEHLVILADFVMTALDEIRREIGDLKKSQQQRR